MILISVNLYFSSWDLGLGILSLEFMNDVNV